MGDQFLTIIIYNLNFWHFYYRMSWNRWKTTHYLFFCIRFEANLWAHCSKCLDEAVLKYSLKNQSSISYLDAQKKTPILNGWGAFLRPFKIYRFFDTTNQTNDLRDDCTEIANLKAYCSSHHFNCFIFDVQHGDPDCTFHTQFLQLCWVLLTSIVISAANWLHMSSLFQMNVMKPISSIVFQRTLKNILRCYAYVQPTSV